MTIKLEDAYLVWRIYLEADWEDRYDNTYLFRGTYERCKDFMKDILNRDVLYPEESLMMTHECTGKEVI